MRSTFIVALCVCSVISLAGQQPGSTLTKGPLYDRHVSGNPDDVSPAHDLISPRGPAAADARNRCALPQV